MTELELTGPVDKITATLAPRPPFGLGSTKSVLAAVSASMLVYALCSAALTWPVQGPSEWGVAVWLAGNFLTFAVLGFGAYLARKSGRAAALITWVYLVSIPSTVLSTLYFAQVMPVASMRPFIIGLAIQILPIAGTILWVLAGHGMWRKLSGVPTLVLYAALTFGMNFIFPSEGLFYPAESAEEIAANDTQRIDVESLYAAQDGLMKSQLGSLRPNITGTAEIFSLLVAGHAYQSVFVSEIDRVADQMADQFGAGSRTLRLANSTADPERYPLASRRNIAAGLASLGSAMGTEDIAFIFLTSHGSADQFALSFWEPGLADLSSTEFAEMLDISGIKNAVIVVSACKSGSFIDEIASPNRLIITAAAADRNSFGCADGADWTEFGRAFFDTALRETSDFRLAFAKAQDLVAQRETELQQKPSLPQMVQGGEVEAVLDSFFAQRNASLP
jgi:Peptidase C13 family